MAAKKKKEKKTLPLPNVLNSMFIIGLASRHSNTFNDNYNLIY